MTIDETFSSFQMSCIFLETITKRDYNVFFEIPENKKAKTKFEKTTVMDHENPRKRKKGRPYQISWSSYNLFSHC